MEYLSVYFAQLLSVFCSTFVCILLNFWVYFSLKHLFSHQEEHQNNRELSKLGSAICTGAATNPLKIPPDHALYILSYGQLGKVGYTTLRLSLQSYGVHFPTYDEISLYKFRHIIPTEIVSTVEID